MPEGQREQMIFLESRSLGHLTGDSAKEERLDMPQEIVGYLCLSPTPVLQEPPTSEATQNPEGDSL